MSLLQGGRVQVSKWGAGLADNRSFFPSFLKFVHFGLTSSKTIALRTFLEFLFCCSSDDTNHTHKMWWRSRRCWPGCICTARIRLSGSTFRLCHTLHSWLRRNTCRGTLENDLELQTVRDWIEMWQLSGTRTWLSRRYVQRFTII